MFLMEPLLLPCLCCPRSKHDRRPRPVVAHEYPSRGLVEGLVAPELLLPNCSVVAVASLRLLQAPPLCRGVLPRECVRTSLAHLAVGVLTCRLGARHRLSVTFEMLG